MARIYDLDADRPSPAVWRDLRRVLVGQAAADLPGGDDFDPLTILVAEDDALTAAELVETLTDAGHRVIGPFQKAEAAIVSAGLHPLDLALLDINLAGDETGVDLARRLRDSWGVPTVFLSGDVTRAARHADVASALVLKPYSAKQVLNAVAAAVRPGTQPRPAPLI
jgi:DNA-binding response OmpR family regulator